MQTNQEIGAIIHMQIGNMAFRMMGVKNTFNIPNGLMFQIKGSKKVNKIVITLMPSDTYKLDFYKGIKLVYTTDDIYFDMLHEVIERQTGLYLSL